MVKKKKKRGAYVFFLQQLVKRHNKLRRVTFESFCSSFGTVKLRFRYQSVVQALPRHSPASSASLTSILRCFLRKATLLKLSILLSGNDRSSIEIPKYNAFRVTGNNDETSRSARSSDTLRRSATPRPWRHTQPECCLFGKQLYAHVSAQSTSPTLIRSVSP